VVAHRSSQLSTDHAGARYDRRATHSAEGPGERDGSRL